MRRNKGISLIVLVITIIVMIILAGSIIITLSNSGIINKANEAVDLSNEKQMQEYITSELILNGWYSGKPITKELLEKIDGVTVSEATVGDKVVPGTWIVEKDLAKTTIYETGDIIKGEVEIWDGTSVEVPEIKDGNWYIYTPEQLKFLAGYVNNLYEKDNGLTPTLSDQQMAQVPEITENTTVYLMADLDLGARQENGTKTVGTEWIPIGIVNDTKEGKKYKFRGIFEGNNHIIRGVYVSTTSNFGGVFGNSNTIKNLTIKDSYIKASQGVGGIVGVLRNGELINCHNVNTQVIATSSIVGGVVGQFSGLSIADCSNTGKISGGKDPNSSNSAAGGVVGSVAISANSIENCINLGQVEGTNAGVGGVMGFAADGLTITNCTNKGNVSGKAHIGGIAGLLNENNIELENCSNSGKILNSSDYTGGIVGTSESSNIISNCVNSGSIISKGKRTGGIVGNTLLSNRIINCINKGYVEGAGQVLGGVAGILFGTLENCYNTGNIKSTGIPTATIEVCAIGGIVGATGDEGTHIIRNTYNTGTITVQGEGVYGIGGVAGVLAEHAASIIISNNYNIGRIVTNAANVTQIGGILGSPEGEVTYTLSNNYYMQGITTATLNNLGEVKTEAFMKTGDFVKLLGETAWEIRAGENSGYPVLIGLK